MQEENSTLFNVPKRVYHTYSDPEKYILHHLFSFFLPLNPPPGTPSKSVTLNAISQIMEMLFQNTYDVGSISN